MKRVTVHFYVDGTNDDDDAVTAVENELCSLSGRTEEDLVPVVNVTFPNPIEVVEATEQDAFPPPVRTEN